jgi:hypothetical protein
MSMDKHGDDNAGRGKPLTRPPELSGNATSRVVWNQVGGMDERSKDFALQAFRSHLQVIFTCRKILHGTSGFTSHPKGVVLGIFIALKSIASSGF